MSTRHSLPITKIPAPDESGMSLLLRIASANLVTLSWLRCRLNVLQPRSFRSEDAASLALLVDVSPTELAARLPDSGGVLGRAAMRYFGAISLSRLHQRFARPQVCPECLHAKGYCRAAWDFSCYTICEEHMTPMVDRCASCGRGLTWNRPAIDVCVCGAYIRAAGRPLALKSSSSVISRRIATTLRGAVLPSNAGAEYAADLPEWWSDLSLDGCMRIVTAMGAIDRTLTTIKVASLQHASSDTWQEIVERGLARLRWVAKQRGDELQQLAPVIWEGALESIALDHVTLPDRQVVDRLAETILGQKFAGRFGSLRGQLSQGSLF